MAARRLIDGPAPPLARRELIAGAKGAGEVTAITEAPALADLADRQVRQGRVGEVLPAALETTAQHPAAEAGPLLGEEAVEIAGRDVHPAGHVGRRQVGIAEVPLDVVQGRLQKERQCMTAGEWAVLNAQNRRDLDRGQANRPLEGH